MKKMSIKSGMSDSSSISQTLLKMSKRCVRPLWKLLHNDKLQPDRAIGYNIPGIILNTLPKSASVYILDKLSKGLNIPTCRIQIGRFPDGLIAPDIAKDLARGGIITQAHLPAKGYNLFMLQHCGIDRIIVHVRDPRQAMLSWVYHIMERSSRLHPELIGIDFLPPENYFSLPLTDLITWHIENWLPQEIKWIEGWLDASEDSVWKLKVLFTTYEDFNQNPDALFDSILRFYDIEKSLFVMQDEKPLQPGQLHYRKGKIDEWRATFTVEQSNRATELIPERLWEKFGWHR